jgi:NAD(P)H-nitrite reductase large subunit
LTVAGVGLACKAGTDCGGCHETIERIIRIELTPAASEKQPAGTVNAKGSLWQSTAPA